MRVRYELDHPENAGYLGHDPAFQCSGPLATLGAIGASLSVHYAIGGHFRYALCHPPIIAPSDDQRQAPFTERLRIFETIASRTASFAPLTKSSTVVATPGIGCSPRPAASVRCAPIPGSNGSLISQVGISRPRADRSASAASQPIFARRRPRGVAGAAASPQGTGHRRVKSSTVTFPVSLR